MNANPEQDFVLKTIETRDVHFVRCWFTDALGNLKSFAVIPSELEEAFVDGIGFDGGCIEGFCLNQESDILAYPEASTFQILPWRPDSNAVARMFCSIKTPEGAPFDGDSRAILKRVMGSAKEKGYSFIVGPALDFYYFNDSQGVEVLDRGGYFDLTSLDFASDLRRDTVLTLEKMGIPVEYSLHAQGPSQHEINLRYSDALSMADAVMTYKIVVKEIARKYGVYASFMPKPLSSAPGNGMHVHQSLFDREGNNAFFDPHDPLGCNLSDTAKHYMAGLLKYAPEFCVITNQYVNSYKRLVPGESVPITLTWAKSSRSTLLRIPRYKLGREGSCRIEMQSPDPAANPYLAFAAMLAAGMKGIEDKLELQDPTVDADLLNRSRHELREACLGVLPETLGEATDLFESSELMREVLGEDFHSYIVDVKRREWESYLSHVSQWEYDRYLEVL